MKSFPRKKPLLPPEQAAACFFYFLVAVLFSSVLYAADAPTVKAAQTTPEAIQAAQKSVVSIYTEQQSRVFFSSRKPGFLDTFFKNFFEIKPPDPFFAHFKSVGTGIILEGGESVLTNYHAVRSPGTIKVKTKEGLVFGASITGFDEKMDLAILRLNEPENLQPLLWGDSSKVVPTDDVFAIGTPGGLEHSITKGIVSAIDRDLMAGKEVIFEDMIQTDAPLNPGNSGGPLLNTRGEMVGLVTVKYARGDSLGFALPANKIKSILDKIVSREDEFLKLREFSHRFGFVPELREVNGKFEFVVTELIYAGKAQKAGLTEGDVILSFNHEHFSEPHHLIERALDIPDRRRVHMMIYRNKRPFFTYLESRL